jgi:hypothetical protein
MHAVQLHFVAAQGFLGAVTCAQFTHSAGGTSI